MSESRISVVFGAQVGELVAGVAEAKEAIEGLRAPVDNFVSSMGGIAEAIGAAFVVDKIRDFATEMAELGERATNTAAIIGAAPADVQKLNVMLALMGKSGEGASKTLEMLAQRVGSALTDPAGRTAQAFQRLGYSQEQLVEAGRGKLIPFMLDVVGRFGDYEASVAKTEGARATLGRGMENLGPLFRFNAEGLRELSTEAEATGAAFSDKMLAAMDQTGAKIHTLGQDVLGLSGQAFMQLKGSIDDTVGVLQDFVSGLTGALTPIKDVHRVMSDWEVVFRVVIQTIKDIINIFGLMGEVLNHLLGEFQGFGEVLHQIFVGIKNMIVATFTGGSVEAAYEAMMQNIVAITQRRGAELTAIWSNIVGRINAIVGGAGGETATLPEVVVEGKKKEFPLPTPKAPKGHKEKVESDDRMAQWRNELQQQEIADNDLLNDRKAKELAFWQGKLALTQSGSKEDEKLRLQIETQVYNLKKQLAAQEERDAIQAANTKMQMSDAIYSRTKATIEGQRQLGKITATQEVADERALLDAKWGADQKYFEQKFEAAQKDQRELQKLQDQEKLAYQKYLGEKGALAVKEAEAEKAQFDEIVGPIKSAISSAATGVAMGTQTLAQASQHIGQSIIAETINTLTDKMFDKLRDLFTTILPDALKSLTGLGQQAASTATIAAAIEAQPIAQAAAMSPVLEAQTAQLVAAITAAAANPEIAGFKFARGGIVPSAAGGWALPSFGDGGIPSILHAGEMVLPKDISQGMQSMIANGGASGGGGHTFNLNVQAMDGASVMRHGPAIVASINSALRNGASLRPNGSY